MQNRPHIWPNLKQKDRDVLPKPKFIDYKGRFQKLFPNLILTLKIAPKSKKIAPKGPKKCKRGPKCGQIKNKKIGLYFQNQS